MIWNGTINAGQRQRSGIPTSTTKGAIRSMSQYTFEVTDASFPEDVLKSGTPVLVDFWAEWCGPCKMIAPIVDELAKKYEGKLRVAKMDVDSQPNTAESFGVQGIPT